MKDSRPVPFSSSAFPLLEMAERILNNATKELAFRCRSHVLEVRRIARDDPGRFFTPKKCRVEGIVNAASHHAATASFANRGLVVRHR